MSTEKSDGKKISLKFLISNSQAGSLIGTGGKSIKELIAVTNCKVNVSSPQEPYPGTSERVVLIVGNFNGVLLAQQLIWEMIAHLVRVAEDEDKNSEWSPETVSSALGTNNETDVISKITIPAATGGLILGKGGSSIKSIAEESGAKILMTGKDEALFTHERVLTLSGEAGACIKCTELILSKLEEQEDVEPYVNRGTTYASPLTSTFAFGNQNSNRNNGGRDGGANSNSNRDREGQSGGGRGERYPRGQTGRGGDRDSSRGDRDSRGPHRGHSDHQNGGNMQNHGDQNQHNGLAISDTTITLSIPNELIGNIFGKQGSTMREIISLSGAKVVVSPRNEFVEGTTNRLLTITGTPTCAQTAHLFITQRLHTPSNPPPRNPKGGNASTGTGTGTGTTSNNTGAQKEGERV